jgi:predicted esterase YcpF (UPF0227 family)
LKQPANLLFYFNGFNSAILEDWSGSSKIVAVADYALSAAYDFRPVSINFRRAAAHRDEILEEVPSGVEQVVFCGSSMGGWFARIMQLSLLGERPELTCEAVAFNPAFDLGQHGGMLVGPQVNHVTGEAYEWTVENSGQLASLEQSVDFDAPIPFFVYVDKGDELIDWQASERRHSPVSRFLAFEGGCHSFDHAIEALADFNSAHADILIR